MRFDSNVTQSLTQPAICTQYCASDLKFFTRLLADEGPDGQTSASGAGELYCDKLGRVRIRFHWQGERDDANASCWVRVAQRSAGGGMGAQFLPRIGQEVLVTFLENNIDRPLILGALYNG